VNRYKIKIEYDGTPFVGWQFQKNGTSVQKVLQDAIFLFSQENTVVNGAGRTDSGVHAEEQVAHFDLKKKIEKKKFIKGVNKYIGNYPISVLEVRKVSRKFHSRYDAKQRVYRYIIVNRSSRLSLLKNKAWHISKNLNILKMKKGSKMLVGTHDFSTFRSSACSANSPIKTLKKAKIKKKDNKIFIDFVSKSFLQQQVRSMVGCLKYLGEGKWSLKKFKKVFLSKTRSNCAPPAPPQGLYLAKIKY
jgi:tRNA pseudouridine38-40 synthase